MTSEEKLRMENLVREMLGKNPKLDPDRLRRMSLFEADAKLLEDQLRASYAYVGEQIEENEDIVVFTTWAHAIAAELHDAQTQLLLQGFLERRTPEYTATLIEHSTAWAIYEALVTGTFVGRRFSVDELIKDRKPKESDES
jgi:hypothetical protein